MPEPIVFPLDLDEVRETWITRDVYARLCGESRLYSQSDIAEALEGLRRARGDIQSLVTEIDQRKRGGQELGKIVTFLNALIRDAFVKGADDPIGALHMLGDYLAELLDGEGGLPVDEYNRVYRANKERRRELSRQAEQIERVRTLHSSRRLWVNDDHGQRTEDMWLICEGCTDPDIVDHLDRGEEIEQYEGARWPCATWIALDGEPAEQHGTAATS